MNQIGKSIVTEGLEFGPVDKLSTEFSITADTFKLPTIQIDKNPEFEQARSVIKTAGISGTIAYATSELGFWMISLPVIISSYHTSTNEWLNINDATDRVSVLVLLFIAAVYVCL